MVDFCKYKNIFGEPGKGVHKYRLGGIAVVDLGLTILLAVITTLVWWRKYNKKAKASKVICYFLLVLLILILIGIFCHWLFCVDTTLNRFIGL